MKSLFLQLSFLLLVFHSIAQESHVKGEVITQVQNQSIERFVELINQDFPELKIQLKDVLSQDMGLYLIQYDYHNPVYQEEEILSIVKSFPTCNLAQWNHDNVELRNTPNDPSFPVQWSMKNIDAERAWNITTGGMTLDSQEIVVAVVDVGCTIGHDELKDQIWVNKHEIKNNNIDDDLNGYKDDYNGWNIDDDTSLIYGKPNSHGTMVAGLIGAKTNNRIDMSSVNWNVKILPVMLSSNLESLVLKSYDYVLKMRKRYNRTNGDSGAYIVAANSSFGVNRGKPADYPAWCEMYNTMGKAGIISVGSGPNKNSDIDVIGDIPTTCPSDYLVAVTNINRYDKLQNAGYGKVNMDLGAPGTDVLSLTSDNSVGRDDGTSFSAPLVSGAVALMYSAIPKDTMTKYKNDHEKLASFVRTLLLTKGTRKISDLDGRTTTNGTLNLYQAVLAAIDSTDTTVSVQTVRNSSYSISLFPNPVKNKLNIRAEGKEGIDINIRIYNMNGALVFKANINNDQTHSFDLHEIPAGLYMIEYHSPTSGVEYGKFIKN